LGKALELRDYRIKHTLRFAAGEDDQILVQVNKLKNKPVGLLHCVVGNGSQAPDYEKWAESDPKTSPKQNLFFASLG
jgi:hypothetical protein